MCWLRRRVGLWVLIAVVAAGCGGTSADTESGPASGGIDLENLDPADVQVELTTMSVSADTHERTIVLIDRFGEDPAIDAVLSAIARGFLHNELAAAIDDNRLKLDGTIDGGHPSGEPSDQVELAAAALETITIAYVPAQTSPTALPVEELRERAKDAAREAALISNPWDAPEIATPEGVAVLDFVLEMASQGFSAEQIVNGLVLGATDLTVLETIYGFNRVDCGVAVIGGVRQRADSQDCVEFGWVEDSLRNQGIELDPASRESATQSPEGQTDTATDDGGSQLQWVDEDMELTIDGLTAFGTPTIDVTRQDGTDSFSMGTMVALDGIVTFAGIGDCVARTTNTFAGTGTFNVGNASLLFDGTMVTEFTYPTCPAVESNTLTGDFQVVLPITSVGLEGNFEGFAYSMPGVPKPISN